jgi:hypothetical protein
MIRSPISIIGNTFRFRPVSLQTQGVAHMKLTKKQSEKLKKLDIVKAAREARAESAHLLNDQGFAVLSIALSHIISDIAEHPEKLVKEFAH